MKVTRKKSYNVSTSRGAGPPPPPIHYLLRRPAPTNQRVLNAQSATRAGQWEPPRHRPTWPRGPAPRSAPVPLAKRSAAGAGPVPLWPASAPPPRRGHS